MTMSSIVTQMLDSIEADKMEFISGLKGGWERWLQAEFAWFFVHELGFDAEDVLCEQCDYTNNPALRVDVEIDGESCHFKNPLIELKCQLLDENRDDFLARFKKDLYKIQSLKQSNLFAIAFLSPPNIDCHEEYANKLNIELISEKSADHEIILSRPGYLIYEVND